MLSTVTKHERSMRAQGKRTMRKLLDAGMRVFARRGYQAARVDDIVRAARTSHGTFYLYFSDKEDLLVHLTEECGEEMTALAESLGPVGPDGAGERELRAFLERYLAVYRDYGPVLRIWAERQGDGSEAQRRAGEVFDPVGRRLGERLRDAAVGGDLLVDPKRARPALMAMLERSGYVLTRGNGADPTTALDTLTTLVHRGFFGGTA